MAIYKIIFKGEITNKGNRAKIEMALAKFFRLPVEKASVLFNGKSYALKKNLDVDSAIAMQHKFSAMGIMTHLVKEVVVVKQITTQEPIKTSEAKKAESDEVTCEQCGSSDLTFETAPTTKEKPKNTANDSHNGLIVASHFHWYTKAFQHYSKFSGRARRKELFIFAAYSMLMSVLVIFIGSFLGGVLNSEKVMPVLFTVYFIATITPSMAVSVRRLHDTGRSGWWFLLNAIPLIGLLITSVFLVLDGDKSENKYGAAVK